MASSDFQSPSGEAIPRDRWGRPKIVVPQPDGSTKVVAYTRCTTFVDCLDDKTNLAKWQQRQAVLGVNLRKALQVAVAAAARVTDPAEQKKKLDLIIADAMEAAGSSDKATVGTAVHTFTEAADRGEDISYVPAEYQADVAAYLAATRPLLEPVKIEQFAVLDELQVGGTFDRIYRLDQPVQAPDGRIIPPGNYIGDVKTGSIEYGMMKIAMQLCVYSRAKEYDAITGARTDLPNVSQDYAVIVHLPAGTGTCQLVWVDIAAAWEAVKVAAVVRKFRQKKDWAVVQMETITGQAVQGALPFQALAGDAPAAALQRYRDATPEEWPAPPQSNHTETVRSQNDDALQLATVTGYHPAYVAALVNAIRATTGPEAMGALWQQHQEQWHPAFTEYAQKHLAGVLPAVAQ